MKKVHHVILLVFAVLGFFCGAVTAQAAVRQTDAAIAGAGNTIVEVPGTFEAVSVTRILRQINEYRSEACRSGYPDPRNPSSPLTPGDYVPIKWSGDLEWIAQTRAAEGSVLQEHIRPNGTSCFTVKHNGVRSWGECLAWNYQNAETGIRQWYGEKDTWVSHGSGVTGHYTSMINPDNLYIGVGAFRPEDGSSGWLCVAGEFSSAGDLTETSQTVSGGCDQLMEVPSSSIGAMIITGPSSVAIGKVYTVSAYQTVTCGGTSTRIRPSGRISWSSSRPDTATIVSSGGMYGEIAAMVPRKPGTAALTASINGLYSAHMTVAVKMPGKGATVAAGDCSYRITRAQKEVAFQKYNGTKSNVTIPKTIKIGGKKYKVTSIAASAFKGNPYVISVTIGTNVKTIGKKAFYKCRSLKKITLKTQLLKASRIGSKAFSKSPVKTVNVPKSKKMLYKTILRRKGLRKKAKVK